MACKGILYFYDFLYFILLYPDRKYLLSGHLQKRFANPDLDADCPPFS